MNRNTQSNRKEFSDGLEEMRTIRSEANPTCYLDTGEKYAHFLSNYNLRRLFWVERRNLPPAQKKNKDKDTGGSY